MKKIGLLGGTAWPSTIEYYKTINQLVHNELKENNSAKIALHSINYNKIMSHYGNNEELIISELTKELSELLTYQPDCIILCCNSLHKYLDDVVKDLNIQLPVFHAINLLIKEIMEKSYKSPLLLASAFSLTDGFIQKRLQQHSKNLNVITPNELEIKNINTAHHAIMSGNLEENPQKTFEHIIKKYEKKADVIISACTEFGAFIERSTNLPIIDLMILQCKAAIQYALNR